MNSNGRFEVFTIASKHITDINSNDYVYWAHTVSIFQYHTSLPSNASYMWKCDNIFIELIQSIFDRTYNVKVIKLYSATNQRTANKIAIFGLILFIN